MELTSQIKDGLQPNAWSSKSDFDWIYQAFRKPIMKYVFHKIGNERDAEEITQDIFLKVFRFRSSYLPKFQLSTWLWTIARNTVFDWTRKHKERLASDRAAGGDVDLNEIPHEGRSIEAKLIDATSKINLVQMMSHLSDIQKNALILRAVHQLSYKEISRKLGVSLSSVKSSLNRAKGALVHGAKGRKEPRTRD